MASPIPLAWEAFCLENGPGSAQFPRWCAIEDIASHLTVEAEFNSEDELIKTPPSN